MKVIISGPRDLSPRTQTMYEALATSGFVVEEIVHGGATGVDESADMFAADYMIPVKVFRARWGTHGKAAGPIRNREMAEYADALIVVKRPGEETKGTSNMIKQARALGLPVHIEEVVEGDAA